MFKISLEENPGWGVNVKLQVFTQHIVMNYDKYLYTKIGVWLVNSHFLFRRAIKILFTTERNIHNSLPVLQ